MKVASLLMRVLLGSVSLVAGLAVPRSFGRGEDAALVVSGARGFFGGSSSDGF